MSRRDLWQELYQRFDPELPSTDSRQRADRSNSPAQQIIELLEMPFDDPRLLLAGTVGTGKTTELHRVREARENKELVVFLDLVRHFSEVVGDPAALERISSWEVCFLAAVALIRSATEQLELQFPPEDVKALEGAWKALAKETHTPEAQFDIGTLAKSMVSLAATTAPVVLGVGPNTAGVVGGLTVASTLLGAVRWILPIGRSERSLPDQTKEMQLLLASVNKLIGHVQSQARRRVLFIIDGLDRIRDIERAKALFLDSQIIAKLACPVVVCGPYALRHHPSTPAVRGFTYFPLANAPVLDQKDPSQHGPGVGFLCELFDRRATDIGAQGLIDRALLEKLAYRSGGRARDFVKFIRELAILAWQTDVPTATEPLVDKVIDQQRRLRETGLHKGHIRLLEEIAADPEHRLPDGALAQELLSYGTLLPYPNESEWYYPHPLLMLHLVKAPGSKGSSSP